MNIDISTILLLCAAQTIGLLIILSQKKFQSPPNKILRLIFISLLVYFAYYYFFFEKDELNRYIPLFLSFTLLSPPIIYFYSISIINAQTPSFKEVFPHIIVAILAFTWSFFTWNNCTINTQLITLKLLLIILGLMHIIYPMLIINKLGNIYQLHGLQKLKVFKYNKEKTIMIRLFVSMMLIHSIILNIKSIVFLIESKSWYILEILNIAFLFSLSYLIGYIIITMPMGIHHSKKKMAVSGFDKYSKSGLSKEKAMEIANKLNELCLNEKVFLDPDINLRKISELIQEAPHQVTETLNRLIGQNFTEYLNNFRVEEFKRLLEQPVYRDYSILALAFEVGFNSKATFNAAFKKITHQTPSEYRRNLAKETL